MSTPPLSPPPQAPGTTSVDWSELAQAWTDLSAGEPAIDQVQIRAQIRALRRRDRLARLNFAGEMLGLPVVLGLVGWAVVQRQLPLSVAIAAALFAVFAGAVTLWSRRGDPGLLLDTPETVMRTALAQARTGLRWAIGGAWTCMAGAVFLTVMAAMSNWRSGWPLLAGGFAFLTISLGLYLMHARRCRRRIAAHEAALAALLEK